MRPLCFIGVGADAAPKVLWCLMKALALYHRIAIQIGLISASVGDFQFSVQFVLYYFGGLLLCPHAGWSNYPAGGCRRGARGTAVKISPAQERHANGALHGCTKSIGEISVSYTHLTLPTKA